MNRQHAPLLLGGCLLLAIAGTASAASDTSSASAFLNKAASDGKAEVQVCQMAMQRSNNPQLKQVAQRLMDDHQHANAQLEALASREHINLAATLEPEDAAKVKKLQSESAKQFDQAWIKSNIKDHKKDIETFDEASKKLDDPGARQFATTTLPVLKTHLRLVEGLQKGGSESGTSSGSESTP